MQKIIILVLSILLFFASRHVYKSMRGDDSNEY